MRYLVAFTFVLFSLLSPVLAQKAYVNTELARQAIALENAVKAIKYTGLPKTEDLIRDAGLALNKNDAVIGLELAQKAAFSAPQLSQPWRVMSRAYLAMSPPNDRANGQKALSAAYLGYVKATTPAEEALSLSFLAQSYEAQGNFRQAMNLYRQSIALESRPDRVKRYEDLIEKHGFRVTNTVITTDQASPSACFTFSSSVKSKTDFTPYVVVQGAKSDFAITSEASQVCVEGLKHGEKYSIILRQGLPSETPDEALRKAGDYQIYVRDRVATLRFTGKNYVLPTVGQAGVPLVSINTKNVDLQLLRIGDRNLIHSVQTQEFMNQSDGQSIKNIIEEKGEKLWQGQVETKGETNKEQTTAVPIQEIMGSMKPGLYILTAKVAGETPSDDDYSSIAAQWFIVSDIGITSFMGNDGAHIIAKSLATAKPLAGVALRLIARNNEVLGTVMTDANGYAKFDAGLSRGKGGASPALVTAALATDYAFLDLKQAAFDFSGRGLKGRTPPSGLDAFISTERGVYRGGETVYATVLLRDERSRAVPNLPITVIIKRPDGVEYKREVLSDMGAGGRVLTLPLVKGVAAGIWRLRVHSDVKADPIGETSFMVEDYVPEKLDLALTPDKPELRDNVAITMGVKHLYGAPASDLATEGSVTFKAVQTAKLPGFEGYSYGLMDEKFTTITKEIDDNPRTDEKGNAVITIAAPDVVTRPMEAEITLRAGEAGGRFISRSLTLPVLPNAPIIGIKKRFNEGELVDGVKAEFDVISLSNGKLTAFEASWKLVRVTNNYQYYYADGRWNYEANKAVNRVADGKIVLTAQGASKISAPISWGNYRLEVRSGAIESAVTFSVGEELERSADAPDMLDVTLDKTEVMAGDKVKLTLASRFNGTASLVLMADKLTHLREITVSDKGTTVEIEAQSAWNTSNWLAVIAHRPLDVAAKRVPGRAIGLAHIAVDKKPKTIEVTLDAPKSHTPRKDYALTLKTNALAGEEVFVTVAAVDLGILNLTRFQSPDPIAHYYGARLSGFETRDLYGFLIDGMQGTKGALRTGGDSVATKGTEGDVPDNPPLAYFSGVVKVALDGTAKLTIPVPAFNGTMRVMATAWSHNRVGKATSDVIVRDPVVMTVTLPRFLTQGDQSRLHVALHNIDGPTGDYNLTLDDKPRSFKLAKGAKTEFSVPFTADKLGKMNFALKLSAQGLEISDTRVVTVNPAMMPITRRTVQALVKGANFSVTPDLLKDFAPETARLSLSIAPHASLDTGAMLAQLLSYPYACSEQTVSAAMPLLSLPTGMMDDGEKRDRIAQALGRLLSRQGANGSFGLWSMPTLDNEGDLWLDSFVTEFLVRAKEKNYAVPPVALDLALDRLRNKFVNAEGYLEKDTPGLAYAGYILARAGRPILGDLRYVNDVKLANFQTPLSKAHIGAGLAMLGDRARAGATFDAALTSALSKKEDEFSRPDYGSLLRDTAGITALIAENSGNNALITKGLASLDTLRGSRYLSTQENMRLIMAAFSLAKPAEVSSLSVNGKPHTGNYSLTIAAKELAAPITITNAGDALQAVLSISGVPLKAEPAIAKGFSLSTQTFSLTGEKVAANGHKANQRYIIKVTASEANPKFGRVMVVDPLPAGFEIENIKLVEGAGLDGYPWLKLSDTPVMTEVRDDRYLASFDRGEGSPKEFSFAYIVRAVTPGRYITPATHVEDMYRPDRFATTSNGITTIIP